MVAHCLRFLIGEGQTARYDKQLDDLVHNAFGKYEPPPILCHYTSMDGFAGIIKDRTFRATAHRDLNDKKELHSVDELVDEVVGELLLTASYRGKRILLQFSQMYPGRRVGDVFEAAIRCFTERQDSLVHWNEFTAAGRGVCLCVRSLRDEILTDIIRPGLGVSTVKVGYDGAEWKRRLLRGYRHVLQLFDSIAADGLERAVKTCDPVA